MTMTKQIQQYAARRITRRLTRAIPWLGGLIALAALGSAIRQKGWLGGTADVALDFTPIVGSLKNLAEVGRGRDFIPDR